MKTVSRGLLRLAFAAWVGIATGSAPGAEERVPLPLQLPKFGYSGTPAQVPPGYPNLERSSGRRPAFLVPNGSVNLALKKTVTSSDDDPLGSLALVTDGEKSIEDDNNLLSLGSGKQWVQIDLGQSCPLHAIVVWHCYAPERVYKTVVVQVADDPAFTKNVHTLFNNDVGNVLGLGAGTDRAYIESIEGKIVDAKGLKARHVRLYSSGNTADEFNHYVEVEVYGLPPQ